MKQFLIDRNREIRQKINDRRLAAVAAKAKFDAFDAYEVIGRQYDLSPETVRIIHLDSNYETRYKPNFHRGHPKVGDNDRAGEQ